MTAAPLPPGQAIALALVIGTLAQLSGRRFHVPVILLLLAGGILMGHHGLGLVDPVVFGGGLNTLLALAVAVVVFEGTFHQDLGTLRRVWRPVGLLITLGGALTAALAALAAHVMMGLAWGPAWLFGAIVSVTGPTVVAPIVRRLPLPAHVRVTLEAESVLVDATGVLLASVLLTLSEPGPPLQAIPVILSYMAGLLTGALIGAGAAFGARKVLRRFPAEASQVARLGTLALALGTATLSEGLARGSAITAAAVAGLSWNAWLPADLKEGNRTFMQDLVQVGLALVFVLVAAGIDLGQLTGLGLPGALVVGVVMAVIRPLVVGLCTVGARFTIAERVFIAWMGPRGIVAAATGLAVSQELARRGVPTGDQVGPLVLLTIFVTVLVQGGLSGPVASWLGLTRAVDPVLVPRDRQAGDGPDREAVAS